MQILREFITDSFLAQPWLISAIAAAVFAVVPLRRMAPLRNAIKQHPLFFAFTELVFLPTAYIFGYTIIYWLVVEKLSFPEENWPAEIFTLFLILLISWFCGKILHAFIMGKNSTGALSPSNYISGLYRWLIYGGCFCLGMGFFVWFQGYSFTGVWISTGLATALLGFALQQTLGDFFAGIAIGLEGGFHIGDWIKLEDGKQGSVVDINWRATWLHDWDNTTHIIPNSKMARQGFTNFGNEYTYYHPWYTIQLPAEIDPRFAKQLLLDGIYRCRHILKHPPPVVRLTDASTVPYTYMCWIYFPNYPAMFRGREELYREIHYVLQKAGVSPAAVTHEWRVRKSEIPVAEPPTIQLALKSQEIFTHLSGDEIEEIAFESQQIHYEAGSKIQYESGEIDAFDIVISGVVEVSMELPSGKKIAASELKPGDSYGLVSMFTESPISSDWTAQTDVTLIRIDLESMKRLLEKHPHLTDRIATVVKQRQEEAESLRKQDVPEGSTSSLREIKTYIKQMLKRPNS